MSTEPQPSTLPIGTASLATFPATFEAVCSNVERVVRGKRSVVQLAVICLFAGGHLLVEDVPGVGKTVLSKALARSTGGRFGRVQFTPDLLPSDVLGTSVWNQATGEFVFHPGPIFSNVLLADEINRASPKTQSALLEAMAENQATVDGTTMPLERPFMVIATQNPLEHQGTYPLPESQLDRFLMKLSMGYPGHEAELGLLLDPQPEDLTATLTPVVPVSSIPTLTARFDAIEVSTPVAEYLLAVARASRSSERFALGISPRALLGWLRAAKVLAAAQGRSFVTPDDAKQLAVHVLAHRVIPVGAHFNGGDASAAVRDLLNSVPVPE